MLRVDVVRLMLLFAVAEDVNKSMLVSKTLVGKDLRFSTRRPDADSVDRDGDDQS